LDKPIFLHQGLLLTLAVFGRGMVHNLFGASYFSENDWKGNYLVLGSAAGILLASLVFAFRLRGRFDPEPNSGRLKRVLFAAIRRPEQLVFFVPITLVTCMLAMKMKTGMITVSWGIEGVLVFLLALAIKETSFRRAGMGLLVLCIGKLVVIDFWSVNAWIPFVTIGATATLVGFLWTRYQDTIRRYL
jgi:hypothetical protein